MSDPGSRLVVEMTGRIRRPVAEVSAQFGDMRHHEANDVHKAVRFHVTSDDGATCRFTQDVTLLGMRQHDEYVLTRKADGSLSNVVVGGTNKGTLFDLSFAPEGSDATRISVRVDLPATGAKRLLKSLFAAAIRRELRKALEEDRVDLEERGYPRKA